MEKAKRTWGGCDLSVATVGVSRALGTFRSAVFSRSGKLPKWAEQRVRHASTAQLTEWLTKYPAAERLDQVVPRP
jgi:hypothetical protein